MNIQELLEKYKENYKELKNHNWVNSAQNNIKKIQKGDVQSRLDKVEATLSKIEEFLNKFFDTKIGDKDG